MGRLLVLATLSLSLAFVGGEAHGAFPGANGVIAYAGGASTGIWIVNPDGTHKRRLADGASPEWSPDGARLAFGRGAEIFVAAADGSGAQRVAEGASPAWSPDGQRLAYAMRADPLNVWDIFTIGADGSGARRLTAGPAVDGRPSWSPDGTTIAFVRDGQVSLVPASGGESVSVPGASGAYSVDWSPDGRRLAFDRGGAIFTVAPNGNELLRITSERVFAGAPAWAPDGTRIAYDAYGDLCVANVDGSRPRRLTFDAPGDVFAPGLASADWQPAAGGLGGEAQYSCERPDWDLAVSAAVDRPAALPGDEVTTTIVVRNVGREPVWKTVSSVGVRVSDLAAAVSVEATRGQCAVLDVRTTFFNCRLDTVFPGESVTVRVVARASEPGSMTTVAELPVTTNPRDYNPANDRAEATTVVRGCTILGTERRDVLNGTPRRDVICGGGGNDRIVGGSGGDVIRGQGGHDVLLGGDGPDLLDGGVGKDMVLGGAGRDVVSGSDGDDVLDGGAGGDRLSGGDGADNLRMRDGIRELATCGASKDRAVADRRDIARGCETVVRSG